MQWAEFYHMGLSGKLIPACGSDAVYRFDGRIGPARQREEAVAYGRKRGYLAYSLHHGPRYTDARPVGIAGIIAIPPVQQEITCP